ncbi:MAG: hypothetical protein J6V99_03080 [Neisseriaceae bacterium]|nr:hypothetical protein [Neisseriaceae bacterium]
MIILNDKEIATPLQTTACNDRIFIFRQPESISRAGKPSLRDLRSKS